MRHAVECDEYFVHIETATNQGKEQENVGYIGICHSQIGFARHRNGGQKQQQQRQQHQHRDRADAVLSVIDCLGGLLSCIASCIALLPMVKVHPQSKAFQHPLWAARHVVSFPIHTYIGSEWPFLEFLSLVALVVPARWIYDDGGARHPSRKRRRPAKGTEEREKEKGKRRGSRFCCRTSPLLLYQNIRNLNRAFWW